MAAEAVHAFDVAWRSAHANARAHHTTRPTADPVPAEPPGLARARDNRTLRKTHARTHSRTTCMHPHTREQLRMKKDV